VFEERLLGEWSRWQGRRSPAEKGELRALPPGGDHTSFDLLHLFKVETRPLDVVRPGCAPMSLVGTAMPVLVLQARRLSLSPINLLSQLVFSAFPGQ